MLDLGAIGFLTPWVLTGLVALPVIWWLLRVTPPSPVVQAFPPIRLLARLTGQEESPAHTPWWILLLRMLIATALIVAGSGPVGHPQSDAVTGTEPTTPLVIVVDNGWPAGAHWTAITEQASRLLDLADRRGRSVVLLPTAADAQPDIAQPIVATSALSAQTMLGQVQPRPWAADRSATGEALSVFAETVPGGIQLYWLSDGVAAPSDAAFIETLNRVAGPAGLTLFAPQPSGIGFAQVAPARDGFQISLTRLTDQGTETVDVRAFAEDGTIAATLPITFPAGSRVANAGMVVPTDLRNQVQRLDIESIETAAAVTLVDERWRRRPVGLVARPGETDRPLTGSLFYVSRALDPIADVSKFAPNGLPDALVDRPLSVVVAADPAPFDPSITNRLTNWINTGGIFLRFAGPRLSAAIGDDEITPPDLVPHALRPGDRAFGGAMTWARAATLQPFDDASPFAGLSIPDDVTIQRQVLAQPSIDVETNTWARLQDGTPLVTARQIGKGWIVFFHVTANAAWSTLPLSGLFVDMLERVISMSAGVAAPPTDAQLRLVQGVDGFGDIGAASAGARPIATSAVDTWQASPSHPPGLYAASGFGRALNLRASPETFAPLNTTMLNADQVAYGSRSETDLRGVFIGLAALLFLLDLLVSLGYRGLLPGVRAKAAAASLALVALFIPGFASAQAPPVTVADENILSLSPRIGYVKTGDARVDDIVQAGIWGLSMIVRRRTAAELGDPVAVDPETDELSLYPLIYWPLADTQPLPSASTARHVQQYLAAGGMIVFDTRDAGGNGAGGNTLRAVAEILDLPPMTRVAQDHVLTRSFFLLRSFPGRWQTGGVWVDAQGATTNDGVSSVIAGSNDWAAAWAMDDQLRPMVAVVPGGARQREMSFRFGINLVMYALTGNYKEDQVHIPEILRRLGQ